ncbi:MAG TPA: POTRA domain-containing protein [Bryobacteraceae bacterium]|nr:POTRA domain-containing protein [Bryobacteraceae bacterium]
MLRTLLISIAFLYQIQAQTDSFPLEAVTVQGTALPKEAVLQLAGLHIGAPIDQAAMQTASQKLNDSGMFASVTYTYAPGPNHGYVLTLNLVDPIEFSKASIGISGANDEEAWRWLAARYPTLDHKVPANDPGQQFVARLLEEHLAELLEGHHVVSKLETILGSGRSSVSFQPDPLPRIASITFAGQSEFTAQELIALVPKDVKEQGYMEREFRSAIEMNIRRAYEERGMYRVRFPTITAQRQPDWAVAAAITIDEGPKYKLGDVQIVGDKLPSDAMLKAAKFRKGEIANWTEIQKSIWELEKPVRRMGYMRAAARPEKVLKDDQHVLDLRIPFFLGPIFTFGQLRIAGLPPNLEAQARKIWKMAPGSVFDYEYTNDFFPVFFRSVDPRQFKNYKVAMQKGSGENVMDFLVTFEPR